MRLVFLVLSSGALFSVLAGELSETALKGISFDVPKARPCPELTKDGLRAVWLEGEPWKGRPTYVFAYVVLPEGASSSKRVPGIVLAHGGGGTAYPAWPKTWAKHGYAAIVVDTCGHLPIKPPGGKWNEWVSSAVGGPYGWGRVDLGLEPVSDQWPYHAVGALVRAHSYLLSLPEVDSDKTGLTGISWGGFLTILTAATDRRFKFAMPVYSCGYYSEMERTTGFYSAGRKAAPKGAVERWDELFDPKFYAPRMDMPVFWFASSNDLAFPFDLLQKTVRLPKARPGLAVRVKMIHSHGPAGENMPELFRFADHVVRGATELPSVGEPKVSGDTVSVPFEMKGNVLKRVELNWCADSLPTPKSDWKVKPQSLPTGGVFQAKVPSGARWLYANFVLEGATGESVYPESLVSSTAVEIELTKGCK